ncbi:cytosolic axial filament protein [Bacillus sp. NRRL B-14911]|uniref:Axial filament protein n=1 Tax=Bacillus infantis NRRL B-14911 TaxID=1367477 RepID=U5LCY4_9BACI|nr:MULTISPECIES: Rne/Rng family ribonuclease [Bacillus]AGX05679.1 axial filament protein [Bacillus infantis NRRL B-14911]EAR65504.1 cytosolic axial filament protein [Bacillus sp. NRRL B-14911]
MKKLVINYATREKRYAVLNESGKPEKLIIDQPKNLSAVGSIYLGTVAKVLPGMNAAFVEIGEEKSGFLHRDRLASYVRSAEDKEKKDKKSISSFVREGEKLLVQVEKDAAGTKGPRLTNVIEFQGEKLIYMPFGRYVAVSRKIEKDSAREELRTLGMKLKEEEEGLIFRTSAAGASEEDFQKELEELRAEHRELAKKAASVKKPAKLAEKETFLEEAAAEMARLGAGEVVVDDLAVKQKLEKAAAESVVRYYNNKESIFSAYNLDQEIDRALKKIVWLDNGAYLIFDEAEALTVIDVNTGKYSGRENLRDTVLRTNEWAAAEAARQIRLRDIGGMILIDFIDMKEERDRQHISRVMEKELRKDERRTRIVGFTPLGILQITRKKTRAALSESLTVKCTACEGTGRMVSAETAAFRLEREIWEMRGSDYEAALIRLSADVLDVFSGEQGIHRKRLEATCGLRLFFAAEDSRIPFYEIRQLGSLKEIEAKHKKQ